MKAEKIATAVINKHGSLVIKIRFPYNLDMIENIRSLPGRVYHSDDKCWSIPIYPESLNKLVEWGFVLDEQLTKYLKKTESKTKQIGRTKGIPGLKKELFPFQKDGVSFIEINKGRALVADEMGLGKTVQAIAWLQLHPDLRPAIVVCPASVKLNWQKEIYAWMENETAHVLSGSSPYRRPGSTILIINYDVLPAWWEYLRAMDPKVIITDECHYYKSNQAKRTKAIKMLAKGIPHFIALSGTPIVNRPIEAYNAIKMVHPLLFPEPWLFAKRYCNARHNGWGWDFNGASHTEELHQILTGTIMIRRLKKDVLPDLPDKIKSFVPMELDNEGLYRKAEANFIQFVRETKGENAARKASNAEAFASIEGLKQLAVRGKLKQAIDWIEDFLESGEKLVVFATHVFVIEELENKFSYIDKTRKIVDRVVKIDGSVSQGERQKAVETFQNNPNCRLFIGNIKAAGVGLTLTAASNVVFLELPWTPGDLVQAEDRCHRIGQKNSVTIHFLLAHNTIEERLAQLIDSKRKVLDSVLDGKETSQESLLTELMKSYL